MGSTEQVEAEKKTDPEPEPAVHPEVEHEAAAKPEEEEEMEPDTPLVANEDGQSNLSKQLEEHSVTEQADKVQDDIDPVDKAADAKDSVYRVTVDTVDAVEDDVPPPTNDSINADEADE